MTALGGLCCVILKGCCVHLGIKSEFMKGNRESVSEYLAHTAQNVLFYQCHYMREIKKCYKIAK